MPEPSSRPAPLFAQVGRPQMQRGDWQSRSMLLVIAAGLLAALLSLLWELGPARGVWSIRPVEVTYMPDVAPVPPTVAPPPALPPVAHE